MPKKERAERYSAVEREFLERRRTARLDIPIKISYSISPESGPKGALTKNISAGGCLLMTADKIELGSTVELEIFLGDNDSEVLKLKGTIVRERNAGSDHEYGISFSDMSASARRLFADFCFAKMYEMIGLSDWPTDKRQK